MNVYEVTKIEKQSSKHGKDFSVKVEERSLGIFSSKKNAEKAIKKCVKDYDDAKDWTYGLTGFYIEEYQLDKTLGEKDTWSNVSEQCWSYTKDGEPFSYTPFSSDWKAGEYKGTPVDAIKIGVGEYAWAHACGKFVPVRVLATPFTPEEWKKKFSFASDASDDCYLVMAPRGHDHPQTVSMFPMDECIPDDIVKQIDEAEHDYYEA